MKRLNHWVVVALGSALATVAIAKLPTPVLTEEQKAKAEEAKAKAAEAAKKAAADEARYQDRVAERYFKEQRAAGKSPAPPQWVPPPAVAATVPSSAEALGQKQAAPGKQQNTAAAVPANAGGGKTPTAPAKKS